eukprot:2905759-Rhodomonas_salina.1
MLCAAAPLQSEGAHQLRLPPATAQRALCGVRAERGVRGWRSPPPTHPTLDFKSTCFVEGQARGGE